MIKKLPEIHRAAFKYKNRYRLKHDGGSAWIKDPQIYDALPKRNKYMITVDDGEDTMPVVPYRTEVVEDLQA